MFWRSSSAQPYRAGAFFVVNGVPSTRATAVVSSLWSAVAGCPPMRLFQMSQSVWTVSSRRYGVLPVLSKTLGKARSPVAVSPRKLRSLVKAVFRRAVRFVVCSEKLRSAYVCLGQIFSSTWGPRIPGVWVGGDEGCEFGEVRSSADVGSFVECCHAWGPEDVDPDVFVDGECVVWCRRDRHRDGWRVFCGVWCVVDR